MNSVPAEPPAEWLSGVIEGFYGQPWSAGERAELFDWMAGWGLNTYLYAPKDDLKHRALWRERYSAEETASLGALIRDCQRRGVRFVFALAPGLDVRYGEAGDREGLRQRFEQMLELGCRDFALLFDDIPDELAPADRTRWGSFAGAQSDITNETFQWVQGRTRGGGRFLFCPTPYCGRMAARRLGGDGYLETVGRELAAGIDVFWTGPEIVSGTITAEHLKSVGQQLRRPPVLWDNLHANDYDRRRFYCGPLTGRAPELRGLVRGWLANPNCEFPLNYVPLRTLSLWLRAGSEWDARGAYLEGMRAWAERFGTVRQPIAVEDLILFGDCFYVPGEDGAGAEALYREAQHWLGARPGEFDAAAVAGWREKAARLRDCCARMAELRDRDLFHALSRAAWDLREELDLLLTCWRTRVETAGSPPVPWVARSDFHLPGTYRGGFVARLQRLLVQHDDGTFTPAPAGLCSNGIARESVGVS